MSKIIAEIGSSCDGDIELCCDFIDDVLLAGASYIKLQSHYGQAIAPDAQHPDWFVGDRTKETRLEYLQRNEWTLDEWRRIADAAPGKLIVSPFSLEAAKRVEPFVCMWKVASGQISNRELLEYLKSTGKHVLYSTGMLGQHLGRHETATALSWTELLCCSRYPCPPDESPALRANGDKGYSSHDGHVALPLAAIVLGAPYVEVHVSPCQAWYGTDAGMHTLCFEDLEYLCAARDAIVAARSPKREEPDPKVLEQFLYRDPPPDWPRVKPSRGE